MPAAVNMTSGTINFQLVSATGGNELKDPSDTSGEGKTKSLR